MKIKHRYAFSDTNKKAVEYLHKCNVPHEINYGIVSFEIFEDDERFCQISSFFHTMGIVSISETVYSKTEIEAAEWIAVRSSFRSLYPQPDDEMKFLKTTYNSEKFCDICKNGLYQKENFIFKTSPRWGSRNFMMTNWVHDELFVSETVRELLNNSGLLGFEIRDVNKRNGTILPGVKQLYVKKTYLCGISRDSIEQESECRYCGRKKYIQKAGELVFSYKNFEGIKEDIIKTEEKFGDFVCSSLILISNKFYRFIVNNNLDRGLVFEPIKFE